MRLYFFAVALSLLSLNSSAGWFGLGGDSWKEEVELQDGRRIIIKRSQTYGGRVEPGQGGTTKEHTISFDLPQSGQSVTWKSEYGPELGRTDFQVLALHMLADTPYLVVTPNLCLSYNKWGRPNPPYVIFKYDGHSWQRIAITELPREFQSINVVVNNSRQRDIHELSKRHGYVMLARIE